MVSQREGAQSIAPITVIVATRAPDLAAFSTHTTTGRSLTSNPIADIQLHVAFDNTERLGAVYNRAIEAISNEDGIVQFVHNDVNFLGYYWPLRLREALDVFDIVGLVGNKERQPGQPSWWLKDLRQELCDRSLLSGIITHGEGFPPATFSGFGLPRQRVKLLDGVWLATRHSTLKQHQLRFDERFDFHFYDMDFCRQAEALGLSCGTWDIAINHRSGGDFNNDAWHMGYLKYIQKWNDVFADPAINA